MDDNTRLLQQTDVTMRWGDMDAVGHLNNAVYFTYMEQVRMEFYERIGGGSTGAGQGPVIANAACEFLREIRYPAALKVSMFGGPPGRSSFQSLYEIRDRADGDILYATGSARVVWVDYQAARSIELPAVLRAELPAPP